MFSLQAYVCQIISNNDYENTAMQQPVVVRGGPVKEIRSFQTEIKLLSTIKHQNLVSLLAFSCSNGTGWMIFECPVYGDLNSYLKQQTNDIKYDGRAFQHGDERDSDIDDCFCFCFVRFYVLTEIRTCYIWLPK